MAEPPDEPCHAPRPLPPPSRLAGELRHLPERTRRMMRVDEPVLGVFDAIMDAARILADETDERPVMEKLESIFERVEPEVEKQFAEAVTSLDEDRLQAVIRFYSRQDYQRYLRRMLGEGGLHRIREAASADLDILLTLLYRWVDVMTPYAVAIEELAGSLDEQRVREFMDVYPAGGFLLRMMFSLSDAADAMVEKVLVPGVMEVLAEERLRRPLTRDVEQLTQDMRLRIAGHSRELMQEISGSLSRKLRGAKDALAFSADSNSQAANSLVEFIDRLLRNSFTEEEVLRWLSANYSDQSGLTYLDNGKHRPTKRGQALCLCHGGQAVAEPSPLHVLAATALNAARRELQQVKHADLGTVEEQRRVESCLTVVEAFVQFGCRMAWMGLSDDALLELRGRLDPQLTREVAPGGAA